MNSFPINAHAANRVAGELSLVFGLLVFWLPLSSNVASATSAASKCAYSQLEVATTIRRNRGVSSVNHR